MPTRRRLLAAVGLSLPVLAGCSDTPLSPNPDEDEPGQAGGTPGPDRDTTRIDSETETSTGTETPTATPQTELDLREANVVDVVVEEADGGYRFDVTLVHDVHESFALVSQPERERSGDDDGEDGYADWWQVEADAGNRLGRRELAHAHGTREFTRSGTVSIPEGVTCVVVRGHDQTHGYGGRVVLVNVETGATAGVRQGSDRVANATVAESCP